MTSPLPPPGGAVAQAAQTAAVIRLRMYQAPDLEVLGIWLGDLLYPGMVTILEQHVSQHRRLTGLICSIASDGAPHGALRLLQTCRPRRHQHFLRGLPPPLSQTALTAADQFVRATVEHVLPVSRLTGTTPATKPSQSCSPSQPTWGAQPPWPGP